MVWKSVREVLYETLKGKQTQKQTQTQVKAQTQTQNNNYLVRFSMSYKEDNAVLFKFLIKSKSRPGLIHHVTIAVKNNNLVMTGCDCEGFRYHMHCWHLEYAFNFIKSHNLW